MWSARGRGCPFRRADAHGGCALPRRPRARRALYSGAPGSLVAVLHRAMRSACTRVYWHELHLCLPMTAFCSQDVDFGFVRQLQRKISIRSLTGLPVWVSPEGYRPGMVCSGRHNGACLMHTNP